MKSATPYRSTDSGSGAAFLKNGMVGTVNIVFIGLMIGMFYGVCSEPTFVAKNNFISLLITGAVICVLSILTLAGFGYAIGGELNNDDEKRVKQQKMGYSLELTALLIMIVIGLIGMFIECLVTPGSMGSTPFESFLIFNSIGSCIGPCFSAIGEILGSIKY
jgi:hypothetical protein